MNGAGAVGAAVASAGGDAARQAPLGAGMQHGHGARARSGGALPRGRRACALGGGQAAQFAAAAATSRRASSAGLGFVDGGRRGRLGAGLGVAAGVLVAAAGVEVTGLSAAAEAAAQERHAEGDQPDPPTA